MGRLTKIILALLVLVIIGATLYFWKTSTQQHLIMGVPYWGIYAGSEINSAQAFSVYTILQYWGDDRLTPREIAVMFPSEMQSANSTTTIGDFFKEYGYEVTSIPHTDISDLLSYIDQDIPIISTLRITPDYHIESMGTERVIIGYSKSDKKVIVHDNQFGNNYQISFEDYTRMRNGFAPALVITPGAELAGSLKAIDKSTPYPARLSIMDSESNRQITLKWLETSVLQGLVDDGGVAAAGDLARLWEEIIAEPDFEKLHPSARMYASFMLARTYTKYLDRHEDAIALLDSTTLPLVGTDFSKPFGEWNRTLSGEGYKTPFWTSQPWVLLGLANERAGNLDAAQSAYERAVQANPEDEDARGRLEGRLTAS